METPSRSHQAPSMVTMRLLGSLELWLANTFLPLLLLTWLSVAGLAHQISATGDALVGLDVILQCLPQADSSSTAREVKWFKVAWNYRKQQNGGGVEKKNDLAQLIFVNVNKAHAGTYECRVENTKNTSKKSYSELSKGCKEQKSTNTPQSGKKIRKTGTNSLQAESATTVQCRVCLENLTVQVNWYKPECLKGESQTNAVVLVENSMNFSISSMCKACTEIPVCRVSITTPNSTDTGNCTQGAVLRENCKNFSMSTMCTHCTEISVCTVSITRPNSTDTGTSTLLNLLCILLGLAIGTLLHMPVIGFLLWQRTRNRAGEPLGEEVAEENQISMAAPVTETEDLTYANLNFEDKVTGPASSNVIYTEIKPSQPKQSGRDGSAASKDVNACPK